MDLLWFVLFVVSSYLFEADVLSWLFVCFINFGFEVLLSLENERKKYIIIIILNHLHARTRTYSSKLIVVALISPINTRLINTYTLLTAYDAYLLDVVQYRYHYAI